MLGRATRAGKANACKRRLVDRLVMCHSELIPGDIERAMKDTKNIDIPVVLDEIGNSIVPVEQNTNMTR